MVYVSRLSQWIEKRFNAKGGGVIVDIDTVARAIIPWAVGVEERYLQGWNRFAIAVNQAPTAALFSRVRIRNPVGSNVIIVLEQLVAVDTTASDTPFVTYGGNTADLGTVVSLTFAAMDRRGNPQPTAVVSNTAAAALGTPFLQRVIASTASADFIQNPNQEIPILPGFVVDVQGNVVNQQLIVSLMWRERALEQSELT